MSIWELALIAVGLSMDAFAVAICKGLSMKKVTFRASLIVGIYFGVFQALMPLIGYFLGSQFRDAIVSYDHWIAFVLLGFLGVKMVMSSLKKEDSNPSAESDPKNKTMTDATLLTDKAKPTSALHIWKMLPLALATSIDALAAGVTFAFLQVHIVFAVTFIGCTTLLLSMSGVAFGSLFGQRLKQRAELSGGLILILIGGKILVEHLEILA